MDTIGKRIELIIDTIGIKKSEFARRIKMGPSSVTKLCKGVNNPSEQTIVVICKEFHVSEEWLRSGTGEMFITNTDAMLDEMAVSHGLSPEFAAIMKRLLKLPADIQEEIVEAVFSAADEMKKSQGEISLTNEDYQRMNHSVSVLERVLKEAPPEQNKKPSEEGGKD